ncbi:MAG: signal recognition particle-docking protein FtsY [Synergistaceae bacterium]|nr:signal recognition particle-docking protein FtsY [Synergistaceae bacterium]
MLGNFAEKLRTGSNKWVQGISNLFSDQPVTDDFWDELEEILLTGDVGIDTSCALIDELKRFAVDKRIANRTELKLAFAGLLQNKLESVPNTGKPLRLDKNPSVVLLIGVNGSGKTTTAGKLALQLKNQGKKVVLAAADTFRAAAVDQLKVWGERTGTKVISQAENSDPAAVLFDAVNSAKASGAEVVIADTAGRLHTKSNLMEELQKIFRVVKRETGSDPAEVLIVLDAVTGQNAFVQAESFGKYMPVSGVVLTKYDNTSKGGIVFSIADKLHLPVRYVGLGEAAEDLKLFDAKAFTEALLNV